MHDACLRDGGGAFMIEALASKYPLADAKQAARWAKTFEDWWARGELGSEWKYEQMFAYQAGVARPIESRTQLRAGEVATSVDAYAVDTFASHAWIVDLKTSSRRKSIDDHWHQLMFYALCVTRAHKCEVASICVAQPLDGSVNFDAVSVNAEEIEAFERWYQNLRPDSPNVGPWCSGLFCPVKSECKGHNP